MPNSFSVFQGRRHVVGAQVVDQILGLDAPLGPFGRYGSLIDGNPAARRAAAQLSNRQRITWSFGVGSARPFRQR